MIDISGIPAAEPVRIIIGAGDQRWPGWIATHKDTLDLLRPEEWEASSATARRMPFCANMCVNT
jgi:predicted SAM-dependent methyltransferase